MLPDIFFPFPSSCQITLDTSQNVKFGLPGFAEVPFNEFIIEINELLSQTLAEKTRALYPEEGNLSSRVPFTQNHFLHNMAENKQFYKKQTKITKQTTREEKTKNQPNKNNKKPHHTPPKKPQIAQCALTHLL